MLFYRFLLILALLWVAAVFVDTAVDHPQHHTRIDVAPSPSESYIQPHHH